MIGENDFSHRVTKLSKAIRLYVGSNNISASLFTRLERITVLTSERNVKNVRNEIGQLGSHFFHRTVEAIMRGC